MTVKQLIVGTLVASLAAGLVPARALAATDEGTPGTTPVAAAPAPSVDLRDAARHAVAHMVIADPQAPAAKDKERPGRKDVGMAGGGGGGAASTVMMVVGLVASIGMTYYMVKMLKKTQNQSSSNQ